MVAFTFANHVKWNNHNFSKNSFAVFNFLHKFLEINGNIFFHVINLNEIGVSCYCEEAAYSYCCSKIETADEIRTCVNRNFQNEYLQRFLSNLLFIFKIRMPNFERNYGNMYRKYHNMVPFLFVSHDSIMHWPHIN